MRRKSTHKRKLSLQDAIEKRAAHAPLLKAKSSDHHIRPSTDMSDDGEPSKLTHFTDVQFPAVR
jgi:hypothetical protein